jgi:hypothetical protein
MIVNFEGQQHTFPDDATDTEITAALGALPKAPRTTDAPMTAGGAYKAVDVGLQEGVAGLASLPRTVGTLGAQGIQGAANWVSRKLGLPEDTRDLEKQKGMVELPTYESALATIQDPKGMFKGQPYTPQNTGEEYLRTLGQFAPNVALGGGGVLRGVVAPALASETAGQLTKGYGAEPYARMAGGVLGATAAAGLANTVRTARGFRGVPALEDVGPAVDQGYTAARTAGVELNPTFVSQGLNDITRGLTSGPNARAPRLIQGTLGLIDDEARALAPAAAAAPGAMSRLTGVQPAAPAIRPAVDFNRLDALRRDLGEIARDFTNPTEQAAARIAQTRIDDLLEAAGNTRGAVLRGDANLLAQTAREARGNAAAEFRMRALEAVRQRAEDQAGAAHSGRNVENAYRQQLKAFVRPDNKGVSPAQKAGLTRAEITEIRQATRGTSFPNILRTFGNLLGGGGGIASGGLAATGYLSGDPRFYAAAGLGFGARNLSNSLMRSRANYLNRMVAARSPLAQQTGFRPPGPPIDATRPSLLSLIPNIPGRQAGGPVEENQPYLVGEAGPELFVPDQAPGWLQGAQYQTPAQELGH